jgi:hypothetical protein
VIVLVAVSVSRKSAVFVAENVFMVEKGSSAFNRGAAGLLVKGKVKVLPLQA